ncbi:aldo/keto reductase [Egicoccus halophilus]|uniref:Aldo/keto reductase n=1 Tax=Egicoccus halophilus TaxID=1670830 RepID=A0A8J3A8Y5_9ACTN|nr:aldo/keto reductase [Egicoccus halophilus]GGI04607.1 aldo/keto reductase [Egicoccus halophilus]
MSDAPRPLGDTGRSVPPIGLGCWQLGGDWGQVTEQDALATLHAAVESGVRLLDTADVYGDGRSEQLIARFRRDLGTDADELFVATKVGRRADPHVAAEYTPDAIRRWVERCRRNLEMDALDLVQLHCPPSDVLDADDVFATLDDLRDEGALKAYGVSVETVDEALRSIAHPDIASLQIIVNAFRQRPVEEVLPQAVAHDVGVLARVPLASGLLSGKYAEDTQFAEDDHRNFNRHGEAFDVGETFAGVPYEVGVAAAREFAALAPEGVTPAQLALRWLLDRDGVTLAIPGARNPEQARANAAVMELPPLDEDTTDAIADLYDRSVREHVHDRW